MGYLSGEELISVLLSELHFSFFDVFPRSEIDCIIKVKEKSRLCDSFLELMSLNFFSKSIIQDG